MQESDDKQSLKARREMVKAAISEIGGVSAARRLFQLQSRMAVYGWIDRGEVPPDKAPYIETWTRGRFRCEDLCTWFPWHLVRRPNNDEGIQA